MEAMADKITVCNKEDGCMSELFGRDCWVAHSMLSLIGSAIENHYEKDLGPEVDAVLKNLDAYRKRLQADNKNYFDDTITVGSPNI